MCVVADTNVSLNEAVRCTNTNTHHFLTDETRSAFFVSKRLHRCVRTKCDFFLKAKAVYGKQKTVFFSVGLKV